MAVHTYMYACSEGSTCTVAAIEETMQLTCVCVTTIALYMTLSPGETTYSRLPRLPTTNQWWFPIRTYSNLCSCVDIQQRFKKICLSSAVSRPS